MIQTGKNHDTEDKLGCWICKSIYPNFSQYIIETWQNHDTEDKLGGCMVKTIYIYLGETSSP
jgi:hypothetical protein